MKFGSLTSAILLASLFAHPANAAAPSQSQTCRPTNPQGGWVGSDRFRVGTPAGGRLVFRPGGPGFVMKDGGLGWKFLWERKSEGTLHIEGHALDRTAPPLRLELAPTEEGSKFQPSYLIFSQPGCWKVTGRLGADVISFVISVEKVGAGPGWQRS